MLAVGKAYRLHSTPSLESLHGMLYQIDSSTYYLNKSIEVATNADDTLTLIMALTGLGNVARNSSHNEKVQHFTGVHSIWPPKRKAMPTKNIRHSSISIHSLVEKPVN